MGPACRQGTAGAASAIPAPASAPAAGLHSPRTQEPPSATSRDLQCRRRPREGSHVLPGKGAGSGRWKNRGHVGPAPPPPASAGRGHPRGLQPGPNGSAGVLTFQGPSKHLGEAVCAGVYVRAREGAPVPMNRSVRAYVCTCTCTYMCVCVGTLVGIYVLTSVKLEERGRWVAGPHGCGAQGPRG